MPDQVHTTPFNGENSCKGHERYVLYLHRLDATSDTSTFPDGHFVPLGGQHISAALLHNWQQLGGQQNEKWIPDELQYVEAEVLRSNTPIEICRLAAGEHQVAQRDVQAVSVSDAFSFFLKTAKEKMAKHNTPYLSDNEIAMAGLQLGLQKFRDRQGKELTESQSVRCSFSSCADSTQFFLPRRQSWFSNGGHSPSGPVAVSTTPMWRWQFATPTKDVNPTRR